MMFTGDNFNLMILPILYKKTSVGKIQQWSIEIEDNKYRTTSGQKDGKLTTANWTICNPKNIGKINAPYENKRTNSLLKLKSFQDDEFLIMDIVEGEGNRSGGAGYIIAQTKDKNIFRSNIKGTREYCTELLINKKEIIGKLGTIKFFNYTPYMIPRFPYLIKIRDYE